MLYVENNKVYLSFNRYQLYNNDDFDKLTPDFLFVQSNQRRR